jgi:heat shock protein HtpX
MQYVGVQTQIWRNNTVSSILLILFPVVLLGLTWLFIFLINDRLEERIAVTNESFLYVFPCVIMAVLVWFMIAYFSHSTMIRSATGSRSLLRTENKRVYNLVENLCISTGMKMPKINLIEDDSLNAFASGVDGSSYTISLSRGIINKLNDEELEAVIAHELTHIRNKDVRLLIVSIIFVGIFAFLTEMLFRSLRFGGKGKKDGRIIIVGLALAAIGYLISILFRFAISRKREYMADAGAAQLTKHPLALASALQKVSEDSRIEAVTRYDVAQLFIENPREKKKSFSIAGIFATHPPIENRIKVLEQF